MDKQLNEIEVRVLGVLIEKEITTPDYYPLSLNALQAGCNQKSSRDPVVNYSEEEVLDAIDSLKEKRFVWQLSTPGSRVPKYEHNFKSLFPVSDKDLAVVCLLMLRGAQTAGEIRGRAERMHSFSSVDDVLKILVALSQNEKTLVKELPKTPGHKENRWMHLLSGDTVIANVSVETEIETSKTYISNNERIASLEAEIATLRQEIDNLRSEFEEFKKQF